MEASFSLHAFDTSLPQIVQQSPEISSRVKEFVKARFIGGLIPHEAGYGDASEPVKRLIAIRKTCEYLTEKTPENTTWLKTNTHPVNCRPWIAPGGSYGEVEDLLVFNSFGGTTADNWQRRKAPTEPTLTHFITETDVKTHLKTYLTSIYESHKVTAPLEAVLSNHYLSLRKLETIQEFPGSSKRSPALLAQAKKEAYTDLFKNLNETRLLYRSSTGTEESFPCDFMSHWISTKIEPHVIGTKRFYEVIDELIGELNHIYRVGGIPALQTFRERILPLPAATPPAPSPYILAAKALVAAYKETPTDRAPFERLLDTYSAQLPSEPSFRDQILNRYFELCNPDSTEETDRITWALEHWRDNSGLMGKAILGTVTALKDANPL
ncbi:MAG: hypothetical protein KBC64_04705 [Simkaniaceae bacterium]|nr:hypothetical protein [Simkaniaceae bacterium]